MNVPNAPVSFDGTLADLCSEHLEAVLPPREAVAAFHLALAEYCAAPSPLFIVRHVAGTTRAKDLQCDGGRFRPSDNSPAWWVHDLLFKGTLVSGARQLATLLESAPCHMFQAASVSGINKAGWHVAHIFNTKDRQTDYSHWTRSELRRRFIRNLHPANCFYVPKAGWQRYGGDRDVLAFAAAVYRDRYGLVWREFLDLADARDLAPPSVPADRFRYAFGGRPVAPKAPAGPRLVSRPAVQRRHGAIAPRPAASAASATPATSRAPVVEYSATRLLFRRAVVERLRPDDVFRVRTRDHGVFEFTRAEFEREFANILRTRSWQEGGIYHMAVPPVRAMRYKVG